MERLSLAFSKIVTVLSEEQLLDDKDGFTRKTAGSEWTGAGEGGQMETEHTETSAELSSTVPVSLFSTAASTRSPTSCPSFVPILPVNDETPPLLVR